MKGLGVCRCCCGSHVKSTPGRLQRGESAQPVKLLHRSDRVQWRRPQEKQRQSGSGGHLFSPHKCSHSLPLTEAKVDSVPNEQGQQFSLAWYLCARKSPYAFHPLSQKLPNVVFETLKEGKDKEDSGTRPPQDLCQQPNKSAMFLDAGQKTAADVGWASVTYSLTLTYQQQE